MKLEQDFREDYEELKQDEMEGAESQDELAAKKIIDGILDITKTHQSQFIRRFSEEKARIVEDAYNQMVEVALLNSGYVSFEIDIASSTAILTYRGAYLFLSNFEGEVDPAVQVLNTIISSFNIISFSAGDGEVVIEARVHLYDNLKVIDKSQEIDRLRNKLREM